MLSPGYFIILAMVELLPLVTPLDASLPSPTSAKELSPIETSISEIILPLVVVPSDKALSCNLASVVLPVSALSTKAVYSTPLAVVITMSKQVFTDFSVSQQSTSATQSSGVSPVRGEVIAVTTSAGSPERGTTVATATVDIISSVLDFEVFFTPLVGALWPREDITAGRTTDAAW